MMRRMTMRAAALGLSLALAQGAVAQGVADHAHPDTGRGDADGQPSGAMQDMMRRMMQRDGDMMADMMEDMMAGMMAGMTDPGGMGGGPMGPDLRMPMMDGEVMGLMMGPGMGMRDAMGPGGPGAVRRSMLDRLDEFDADRDGTLGLAEFEALHAAMIRERTVDLFQHLDADGDGRITAPEMAAPAGRMERWEGPGPHREGTDGEDPGDE